MALPSFLTRHFSLRNHCFTGSLPLFSRKLPGAANYGRSVASLAINGEKSTNSEDADNPTASDDALATAEGEGESEQTFSGDGGSASATGAGGTSEPESVGSSEGGRGVVKKP